MEIQALLVCFLLICLCIQAFLLLSRWISHTKKLPPGPTGLPIVGSLFQLGERPHESLAELAKAHGPLMTLRLGFITTVVASSAQMAKEILQKKDQAFSGRHVPDVITAQPSYEATMAWVPAHRCWRERRRICNTGLFSTKKLDALQDLRHKKVQELVDHLRKKSQAGMSVDMGQIAFATTLNLISNTLFSVDLVDPEFESAQEFQDLVWRIMEDSGRPNLSDYFPLLRRFDLQGIKCHIKPSYESLHEIFDDIIDRRLQSRASGLTMRTDDFLDVLLDQCQEDGSNFNRQNIKPLLLDLFIAGTDTTSLTVEWAMAELLHNYDMMRKARQELTENIGMNHSVKESDIDRLPYLQAIVKETMRLHPPVPLMLPHKAENDVEVCGFTVPKDSQVLVNVWAISRDTEYWENPTSFFPGRFLGSSLEFRGHDFEYLPFGAGRRICPGLPLGVRMVHLMLASLIHSFHWKLLEGTMPEHMDMGEKFGVTLKKAIPLHAIPIM